MEPSKWSSILNKCLLSFYTKGFLARSYGIFWLCQSGQKFVMLLIFKENSFTSCLLTWCLTLTALLRVDESLSWTSPPQHISSSKQQKAFQTSSEPCGKIRTQRSFALWQGRLSPLKPGEIHRGPHCSSSRPSPVCWPGIWGGECGPLNGAKDVTLTVPRFDCTGVCFLWDNHAFQYPDEVVLNVRVQCVLVKVTGRLHQLLQWWWSNPHRLSVGWLEVWRHEGSLLVLNLLWMGKCILKIKWMRLSQFFDWKKGARYPTLYG